MLKRSLSYDHVIRLAITDDDMIAHLNEVVMNHKNWGQFKVQLPSYIVVALIDRLKSLAEEALGDKVPLEIDSDEFLDDVSK